MDDFCWQLWNNRNQCLHKLSCRRPNEIIRSIEIIKDEWRSQAAIVTEHRVVHGWQAPPEDAVKLNVDAAFFSNTKEASLGMVLRDHTGRTLLSAVRRVGEVYSPLQAELLAIQFGLEECKSQGLQTLIIESDSLLAIKEIDKGHDSFSEWFSTVSDILQLAQQFNDRRFCHSNRGANECAHMLAKISNYLGEYKVWRDSLPSLFCNPDMS